MSTSALKCSGGRLQNQNFQTRRPTVLYGSEIDRCLPTWAAVDTAKSPVPGYNDTTNYCQVHEHSESIVAVVVVVDTRAAGIELYSESWIAVQWWMANDIFSN